VIIRVDLGERAAALINLRVDRAFVSPQPDPAFGRNARSRKREISAPKAHPRSAAE
jgi:hypothetical protein